MALTYAREKEYLNSAAAPGHTLVVFSAAEDGEVVQADPVLASRLLLINKWAYEQALGGNFNPSTESFRTAFIQQFGTQYALWSLGAMVEATPNVYLPGVINLRDIADDELQYTIWFATEIFEQQFDEYEIKVVPPVDELDSFFLGKTVVKAALAERTPDETMELIQASKEGYPETYLQAEMFEWFDPTDPTDKLLRIATYWSVVIYGIAGRNVDAIKEAIRDHILDNSEHTKEEWAAIFPEIFTSTEFIFVPMWKNYAVPNRELEAGMYSSVVNALAAVEELKRLVRGEGYTDEFITSNAEIFGAAHRGISIAVTGGPYNRDEITNFVQRYPDYINVDSTSVDFMRMNPETRRLVLTLAAMMAVAEDMVPDSAVPVQFTRLVREGVLYVATTLDRFQLIVASKYSAEDASLVVGDGEPEF
ncbi:hypothetical protein D9M70_209540 [compost metagenome]